ncbi:uncharacterized protein [Procambarus clarkii]|uniref:uncharacterized protein n=1 Tax=Procambarus clarkii TaxID=6728 RepID=UPI0037422184
MTCKRKLQKKRVANLAHGRRLRQERRAALAQGRVISSEDRGGLPASAVRRLTPPPPPAMTLLNPSSSFNASMCMDRPRQSPSTSTGVAVPSTSTGVAVPSTSTGVAVPSTSTDVAVPSTSTGVAVPSTAVAGVAVPSTYCVAVPSTCGVDAIYINFSRGFAWNLHTLLNECLSARVPIMNEIGRRQAQLQVAKL